MKIEFKELEIDRISLIEDVFQVNLKHTDNFILKLWGAFFQEELISYILLETRDEIEFSINRFEVLPMFRGQGIATELLTLVKNSLLANNKNTSLLFRANTLDHKIKEANYFFKKNHLKYLTYDFTKYSIKKELFFINFINKFFSKKNILDTKSFSCCYFNELSKEEISEFNKQTNTIGNLDLFILQEDNTLVPELTIFIKKDEKLIAWCIVEHNIIKQEILISHTFVQKQFRSYAIGLQLWQKIFVKTKNDTKFDIFKFYTFHFDKNDLNLLKLYNILFKKYLYLNVDFYKAHNNL